MKKSLFSLWMLFLLFVLFGISDATPSTNIWNPNTDIQTTGSWHFGIDNYFTLKGPSEGGYAFPTDIGLTYGILPGFEVGIDVLLPQSCPLIFNAKYGVCESDVLPAFAIGGFGFGTEVDVTDQNVIYGVLSKTFIIGRLSAGYFVGNEKVLLDTEGKSDNSGIILAWDKAVSEKLWLCVDYASSKSVLGACFYGFSWSFAPNVSIIFGYGTYNKGGEPTVSTQLDINI